MREFIRSVSVGSVEWMDEYFRVTFVLQDDAGQKLFESIHNAVQCELLPGADRDELVVFPSVEYASSFMVNGVLFYLRDGEVMTDDSKGWYSLWIHDDRNTLEFLMAWDVEAEEWTIRADFPRIKHGDDRFDYTNWSVLAEDFWVEPSRLIRRVFGQ